MSEAEATVAPLAKHEAKHASLVQFFVDRAAKATELVKPPVVALAKEGTGARAMAVGGSLLAGGATAALLGAAHAKFGLDQKGWPLDGVIAGLGAAGGVFLAPHYPGVAAAAASAARTAFDVFVFRKSYGMCSHDSPLPTSKGGPVTTIPAMSTPKVNVMTGEDPIVMAAEKLG